LEGATTFSVFLGYHGYGETEITGGSRKHLHACGENPEWINVDLAAKETPPRCDDKNMRLSGIL
jgi:hypothetical protein